MTAHLGNRRRCRPHSSNIVRSRARWKAIIRSSSLICARAAMTLGAMVSWSDIRPRSGSADLPAGQLRTEAFEFELSTILNSSLLQRQPPSSVQSFDGGRRDLGEPISLKEDARAVVSDRWDARPGEEREQPEAAASRPTISAVDRDRTSASRARRNGANKRRPRSAVAPIVRAGLAAVLAIAVVVTGTYFARSRISDAFVSKPMVTIVHEGAPVGQVAAAGPVTITPQPTVARFQDLVFPLPHLYGIYVINSGRLFELEALPGQAPDPRVAVSAAIRRTSHTVLPDGRVAFLLFRRDMATNISERVSVRVVAKINRSATDPGDEPQGAGQGSEWAIRNIAVDFRVAPVEHNKEMVLLLPENSDFAFPSGRYALVLKGQAYDFTVGGPITDADPMSGAGRGGEWKLLPRMPTASGRDRRIVLAGRASESSPRVVKESSSE